jgi:hypothetical protein
LASTNTFSNYQQKTIGLRIVLLIFSGQLRSTRWPSAITVQNAGNISSYSSLDGLPLTCQLAQFTVALLFGFSYLTINFFN